MTPHSDTIRTTNSPVARAEAHIRRATVADAALVQTMLIELATHENTAPAVQCTVEDWQRMLANPAVVVLIAYLEDKPVGYVSGIRQLNLWVGDEIFAMDDLYVRAGYRDHGIGGRLMAALAEHAAEDNLPITWGVREDNDAGQRFYRRLGATLRTKVVASWQPQDYRSYAGTRAVTANVSAAGAAR